MFNIKKVIVVICLALGLSSCDTLTQIANQASEIYNLTNCSFDINNVNDIKMMDVSLHKGMNKSDLNVTQLLSLTNSIMKKTLPVSFNVNLDVDNPNSIAASMTKMDYILTLNGKEVISSTLSNGINVPANSKGSVSIPISTDLFQLFSGESADAIVSLAFKLAGASSEPVNIGLKVKPYITINNRQLAYPDYINLNKTLQ